MTAAFLGARRRRPGQLELAMDFGDDERFIDADDALDAALHAAAQLHLAAMKTLLFSTQLSPRRLAEILDFYGPGGRGRYCYLASQYLLTGRVDDDFEEIAWRIRRRCREMMTAGRAGGGA